jgi:hypothetical protein
VTRLRTLVASLISCITLIASAVVHPGNPDSSSGDVSDGVHDVESVKELVDVVIIARKFICATKIAK